MRAPSVTRRGRAAARPNDSLLFENFDIPPPSFWQDSIKDGFGDLTAKERHAVAQHYCSVASRDGSAWKASLQRGMAARP